MGRLGDYLIEGEWPTWACWALVVLLFIFGWFGMKAGLDRQERVLGQGTLSPAAIEQAP